MKTNFDPRNIENLNDMFNGIKNYWKEEQKKLLFNKKSRQEEKDYFNLIKFLFSSPNKI